MRGIKRDRALIVIVVSLSIIISSFIYIYSLRDKNVFELKDIKGDRDTLSDLVITGYLQDRYHGNEFKISNGKITHQFKYYDNTNFIKPYLQAVDSNNYGKYNYSRNYSYKVARDANIRIEHTDEDVMDTLNDGSVIKGRKKTITTYADKIDVYMTLHRYDWDFLSKRRGRYSDPNFLMFKTGVYIESEKMDFSFNRDKTDYGEGGGHFSSDVFSGEALENASATNGFTELAGRQYITEVTFVEDSQHHKKCTGEAGIYMVEEYGHWLGEDEVGKVRKIVSVDLDGGKTQILGLHGIENKLVLLMIVDDVLTFRAYDPDSGDLMGELPVPKFEVQGNMCAYDAYIDGNRLTLDFSDKYMYSENVYKVKNSLKVLSIEVDEDIKLLHCIDNFDLENRAIEGISNIVSVDGRLTILVRLQDIAARRSMIAGSIDGFLYNHFLYPIEFTIFIFDDAEEGNLIYEGEIVTDAHEDNYVFRHRSNIDTDYNIYDKNRKMAGVKVEGVGSHD